MEFFVCILFDIYWNFQICKLILSTPAICRVEYKLHSYPLYEEQLEGMKIFKNW